MFVAAGRLDRCPDCSPGLPGLDLSPDPPRNRGYLDDYLIKIPGPYGSPDSDQSALRMGLLSLLLTFDSYQSQSSIACLVTVGSIRNKPDPYLRKVSAGIRHIRVLLGQERNRCQQCNLRYPMWSQYRRYLYI